MYVYFVLRTALLSSHIILHSSLSLHFVLFALSNLGKYSNDSLQFLTSPVISDVAINHGINSCAFIKVPHHSAIKTSTYCPNVRQPSGLPIWISWLPILSISTRVLYQLLEHLAVHLFQSKASRHRSDMPLALSSSDLYDDTLGFITSAKDVI